MRRMLQGLLAFFRGGWWDFWAGSLLEDFRRLRWLREYVRKEQEKLR